MTLYNNVVMGIKTRAQSTNLGLNIEQGTRVKYALSIRKYLDAMRTDRTEAIKALNARRPMERVRALGFTGDGAAMLEAPSNLEGDTAWLKLNKDVEQLNAQLGRKLLQVEAFLAGALKTAEWRELTDDEMNDLLTDDDDE